MAKSRIGNPVTVSVIQDGHIDGTPGNSWRWPHTPSVRDSQRKKPSLATLWRKWKLYREGGFEALLWRRRSDRGQPRSVEQKIIDKAIELKKDQPRRSDETINQFLQHEFKTTLPKSTLYWHLKKAGATRLKLGVAKQKVRCRWTRDQSNALWVGDFEDGPYVIDGDCAKQTHLSAFIDRHSRFRLPAVGRRASIKALPDTRALP